MTRALVAFALLLIGCADDTRVDVYFEADPALEARAQALEIVVTDTDGQVAVNETFGLGARALPLGVRLTPRGGDATRSFLAVGRLLESGGPIARVAGGGSYVAGESREITLRFTDGCGAGLDCAGPTTCVDTTCEPACPPGLRACGEEPLDGGMDAGPGDAGPLDAGPPFDAGADAGPPLPDAGEHTPAFLQRTVARFDHSLSSYTSALGTALSVDASGEDWLVLASAGLSSSSTVAGTALARLMVDGAEVAEGGTHVDSGSGVGPWTGFALLPAGSTHTVDVELIAVGGASTSSLVDLRVVAFPLPNGTRVEQDEAVANQLLLSSGGYQDIVELRFTPTVAGRWLVLGQASVSRLPSLAGFASVRVTQSGGAQWPVASGSPPHLSMAFGDYQTFFLTRAPMLAGGSEAVFTLEVEPASGNSNVSHARLMAIDLSGFAATAHDQVTAAGTTGSATDAVLATATAPAGPLRDWIAIGSVALLAPGERGATLRAATLQRRYTHPFNAEARLAYPFFGALTSAAGFDATAAAFAPGPTVEHREAIVHLLAL